MAYQKKVCHHNANSSTARPDAKYPFPTELDEEGRTVYLVPLEAPEDSTLETPFFGDDECSCIHFIGGKSMRVHFEKTTDRDFAFEQKAYLNTLHTQEYRRARREELFEGATGGEDEEYVSRDDSPLLRSVDEGFVRVDYSDLPERIAAMIDERHPDNPLYRKVYLLCVQEMDVKSIAQRLNVDQAMVYFFKRKAYRIAKEYKQKFLKI